MAVDAQPLTVFLKPLAQHGPLADEGFMRHLDGVAFQDD